MILSLEVLVAIAYYVQVGYLPKFAFLYSTMRINGYHLGYRFFFVRHMYEHDRVSLS